MAPVSVLELDLLKCISNRFWLQCSCKALLQFFSVKASALSLLRMGDPGETTKATAAKSSLKKKRAALFFILCRSVCPMLMNLSGVEFLVSIKLSVIRRFNQIQC